MGSASNWVFASRINDLRYGVGHDFYIEASQAYPDENVVGAPKLLVDLHISTEFEGAKLDLPMHLAVQMPELPIYKVAKEKGMHYIISGNHSGRYQRMPHTQAKAKGSGR